MAPEIIPCVGILLLASMFSHNALVPWHFALVIALLARLAVQLAPKPLTDCSLTDSMAYSYGS